MALIRIQNNVPEVYPNSSRDFQLLCRALDCVQNGLKYNIDSITDTLNTGVCNNRLLQLLQTKLGFFTTKYIDDDDLRFILMAFPYIVRYKGSRKGINRAVNVFMKLSGVITPYRVVITNKDTDGKPLYIVQIVFETQLNNTYILDEILKYVLPPCYIIRYAFYKEVNKSISDGMYFDDKINFIKINDFSINRDLISNSTIISKVSDDIDDTSVSGSTSRITHATDTIRLTNHVSSNQISSEGSLE